MSDEVQESFEEYLELEQHIEQLRSQEPTGLPAHLTPEQARIYGMARLFHIASQPIADPRPEFKAQLYQRLQAQMPTEDQFPPPLQPHSEITGVQGNQLRAKSSDADEGGKGTIGTRPATAQGIRQFRNIYRNNQVPQPTQLPSTHPASTDAPKRKKRGLSRRTLFTGGTIAASLLAGAGVGAAIEHSLQPQSKEPQPNLKPLLQGATWHTVASLEQLGKGPILFATDTITGYVIRQTENSKTTVEASSASTATTPTEQIIAFSAACTHLGCIVEWQEDKRQFPCPCHNRTFDATGKPVPIENGPLHYVSLPRLETKIENGNIYVKVPIKKH
jgi:Rieske Fe-S protein